MDFQQGQSVKHDAGNEKPGTRGTARRNVIISSDSTCDLPQELLEQFHIEVIPLTITLGEESFFDGVDFNPERIYQRFHEDGILPQTAAPSIQQYTDFFTSLRKNHCDVVHLTISSELSSSYANACLAAEEEEGVFVVDSRMLSNGVALLAIEGAEERDRGRGAQEIAEHLRSLTEKVQTSFVLDTLEYMRKGGRCSGIVAFGSNLLHIKPALTMHDGAIRVYKKYRGAMERVYVQYVQERLREKSIRPGHIFLADSGGIDEGVLAGLEQLIHETAPLQELHHTRAGCTVSAHCGPRTIGLFYLEE